MASKVTPLNYQNFENFVVNKRNTSSKKMGSIPHLSILKGPSRSLKSETNLCRLFEQVAVGVSEKPALVFEDLGEVKKTSYHDLNATANRIARLIKATIVDKSIPRNADGDYIVAICMQPSDELISVLLAVWKAGAAYLPLDPTFPASRIEYFGYAVTKVKAVLKMPTCSVLLYGKALNCH
ncbi:PREDICTED: N-(5-amino-5-carboxypentanoyl)-L-cysteinyl-D-valine synthase-like [Nicrophorus vespilloides]|uniref:N-(5-amino-5-carboxypentanoyl)-L-cysteinyl-D- valine synthase-like n=1 Tax=Nicrophorus vespilloides TaxID=110193 RepID=A0ABM1MIH2_NICVS|nr:PREDICTED: N-(5-amino-5-carboxypentanoyl)-L-cysteinyl-D-valine synthase-like [Nicrophorus vespilloides]